MKFAVLILTSTFMFAPLLAPAALAHPEPEASKQEALKAKKAPTNINDIKLPTQAEIKAMQDNMPDMNALMGGMMEIMKDEKMQSTLRSASKTMAGKMADVDMTKGANGLPDMNAMMGAMLSMMGDEAVMGDMLSALAPISEQMETLANDAAPSPKAQEAEKSAPQ